MLRTLLPPTEPYLFDAWNVRSPRQTKYKWYVAQVTAGQEAVALEKCRAYAPAEAFSEAFLPEHEAMRKVGGQWRVTRLLLFPGYVFFVASSAEELARGLAGVPCMVRLLGNDCEPALPLTDEERDWLAAFMDDERVVRMSEGVIEGDKVTVTRGPLMGMEAKIVRIDRHKRRATIDVQMFGRSVPTSDGLEIVRKTK